VLKGIVELKDALGIFLLLKDKSSEWDDLYSENKRLSVICHLQSTLKRINTTIYLQRKSGILTEMKKTSNFRKKFAQ
jgi:hypothetical protein